MIHQSLRAQAACEDLLVAFQVDWVAQLTQDVTDELLRMAGRVRDQVSYALRSFSASSTIPRTIPNTAWRIVAWPKARGLVASFGSSSRAGW